MRRTSLLLPLLACLALVCRDAHAQSGANVLVVVNDASPASAKIAAHYIQRRNIPSGQIVHTRTTIADEISRSDFDRLIQTPIANWLAANRAQDRILYVVLTKGVPLRIGGTLGRNGTIASVDSELTLLYRRLVGLPVNPMGSTPNPYFLGAGNPKDAARFTHVSQDIYLVTRLDGFTIEDVIALIDRGLAPSSTGRVLLDQRASLADQGNDWLASAAKRLADQGLGDSVTLEGTSRPVSGEKNVIGYYSWGSNDPGQSLRAPAVQFLPGAIAGMFVSTDARTFIEPPASWKPGGWDSQQAYYAGSPQSLTGDLIRAGVTGVSGQVAEPYLDSAVRPEILFPAYLAGLNLAESFYLAMPALSWQTIVIGDPLCAPVQGVPIAPAELDPAISPETELPAQFSTRRLAQIQIPATPEVLKLFLRSQSRIASGDKAGARESLEQAVAVDDKLTIAWQVLASLYDEARDYPKATAIYRKLLERDPKDPLALNNLAYALAVREGRPAEALPLAERANMITPRSASIMDTLGWIKHLLGDDKEAARLIIPAALTITSNADAQLHAAVVCAALGALDDAAKFLKAAEQADPSTKDRAEFKDVQRKIGR
jgi:uncharacterized protein (TIGR03790 family)